MERPRRPLRDLTTSNIRLNQTSEDKETFTANKTKAPKLLKQKITSRGIAEYVDDPLLIELGSGMVTRSMVQRTATITKSNNQHMLLIPGNFKLKGSGGIQPSSCLSGPEEKVTNAVNLSASAAQGESDEKSPSTQPPSLGQSCRGRELRSRAKKQSSNVPFRDVAQRLTSNKTKSKARQDVGDETFIISSTVEVGHTEKPATSPQTDVPQRQESVSMTGGENGDENHDVLYFRCVLEKEVDRLERVCAKWSSLQNSTCLPQEVSSLIDVALGQTGLLINKKFSQFRKLIDKCELKQGRLPIFLSDLEGFWDIICLQVKNIDNRFFHLEKLEVNNWQESSPEVKSFIKKKKVPILIKPEHNVKTSVRDFIEATRRKQQLQSNKENAVSSTSHYTRLSNYGFMPSSVLASSHRDILKESHQRNKKLTPILMKVSKCAENTP